MNPNIKCTCPFGKPEINIAANCPVHGGMKNDYPLIPMSEITDEARVLAVAWMEEDDRTFIANKHKLASDIMNYARRHNEKLLLEHLAQLNVLAKNFAVIQKRYDKAIEEYDVMRKQLEFKDEEIKLLKHLHK